MDLEYGILRSFVSQSSTKQALTDKKAIAFTAKQLKCENYLCEFFVILCVNYGLRDNVLDR